MSYLHFVNLQNPKSSMFNKKTIITVLGLLLAGSLFYFFNKDAKKQMPASPAEVEEPPFTNEGSLSFQSPDGALLSTISIEIADNNSERAQGLMHRRAMADSLGMLFIYSRSQPQSFWMKNTHISLDIIFVDDSFKIVTIQRDAVPHSRNSIPSTTDAQYIVEVVSGYCNKNNIQEGDFIEFERL